MVMEPSPVKHTRRDYSALEHSETSVKHPHQDFHPMEFTEIIGQAKTREVESGVNILTKSLGAFGFNLQCIIFLYNYDENNYILMLCIALPLQNCTRKMLLKLYIHFC